MIILLPLTLMTLSLMAPDPDGCRSDEYEYSRKQISQYEIEVTCVARSNRAELERIEARLKELENPRYAGLFLQPGDVVDFPDGALKKLHLLDYGHTAMFLGVDPQTGQRSFLDFTTSKSDERAFEGRILPEKEFLQRSAENHQKFRIFRLKDGAPIDPRRLLAEAKLVSAPPQGWSDMNGRFGVSDWCSTAVARVLSNATGREITALTPDAFARSEDFRREGGTLSLDSARRDAETEGTEAVTLRAKKARILGK